MYGCLIIPNTVCVSWLLCLLCLCVCVHACVCVHVCVCVYICEKYKNGSRVSLRQVPCCAIDIPWILGGGG